VAVEAALEVAPEVVAATAEKVAAEADATKV